MEIPKTGSLEREVFTIANAQQMQAIALKVYDFQFHNNLLYQKFSLALNRTPENVKTLSGIPFLPISLFKSHRVATTAFEEQLVFRSSGTTLAQPSTHYVWKSGLYIESFLKGFEYAYGSVSDYRILGLLPSYLERSDSSLVYMVSHLIRESRHAESGFYLNNLSSLATTISTLEQEQKKTLLFGVSFALLDFAEAYPQPLISTVIMETGGMKGRRRELTKPELYQELHKAFGDAPIHSEYGMTELLSQAYGVNGFYQTPPWMKILVREETDPLCVHDVDNKVHTGGVNVIDLANLYSCAFIAVDDRVRLHPNGRFEILGRLDNSDVRGCSQLVD